MIIPFNSNKREKKKESDLVYSDHVHSFIESLNLDGFVKAYSDWLRMNIDEKIKLENSLNKARLKNIRKGE